MILFFCWFCLTSYCVVLCLHSLVLHHCQDLLIVSKPADVRMDGPFPITMETILPNMFPQYEKFRWVHQLDYATSGVLCTALSHEAASAAAQLFQNRRTSKEYLAIVSGHIPIPEGISEGDPRFISDDDLARYKSVMELPSPAGSDSQIGIPMKPRPAGTEILLSHFCITF
jgi:23S rRNA-/tRNA-specific pseudouridylate synthase